MDSFERKAYIGNMKVELIPVIELGFKEEETYFIQPHPNSTYWLDAQKWEQIFSERVSKNGYQAYKRIKEGYPFYSVNQFSSQADLIKLIHFHLGGQDEEDRIPLEESCALFGGYVLKVNDQIVFTPQCCSLLSDIATWKQIVQDEFDEGYICLEGHPCPLVKRSGEELKFTFEEEWESFIPPAMELVVDRKAMVRAMEQCQKQLDAFGRMLNALDKVFDQNNIADILICDKA